MGYGNDHGEGDQEQATSVWDTNYKMVHHMGTALLDSTSNNNDATNNGSSDVAGQVGRARSFVTNDFLSISDSASLDITPAITLSILFNLDASVAAYDTLISKRHSDANQEEANYVLRVADTTDELDFFWTNPNGSSGEYNIARTTDANLATGTWYHIRVTMATGAAPLIYVDDVSKTVSTSLGTLTRDMIADSNTLMIGQDGPGTQDGDFDIDEIRLSDVVRSLDWGTCEFAALDVGTDAWVGDTWMTWDDEASVG